MVFRHWVAGLTLAASMAILVAPPAAHADTVHCLWNGVAQLSPPLQPLIGGDSQYVLGGGGECQYVDTTGPGAGTAYETWARISSTGWFRNDVCLTGWIESNWDVPPRSGTTTIEFWDAKATDVVSMRYIGRLTAGTGDVAIKDVNGDPNLLGDGWLVTLPNAGSCGPPPGVSGLDVLGQWAITL